MTFDARFVIVALSTYTIACGLLSLAVPYIWRFRRPDLASITRANDLLRLRLAPAALGTVASLCAIVAFTRYEPRADGENMSRLLATLALAAPVLWFTGTARLAYAAWRTHRAMKSWMGHATPVSLAGIEIPCFVADLEFPVVAIVGVLRPRLIVARTVLDHCSADELRAIFAHERAHIARRDNARQALFQLAPDPLLWSSSVKEIHGAWHDATEEAADDAVAKENPASRIDLASALVRVARLVKPGMSRFELPASALYRGEPLERRVRRLVDDRPNTIAPRFRAWQLAIPIILLLIGLSSLGAIQRLVEMAVRILP